MTVELQLGASLVAFLKERNCQLADGPLDDLVIPLKTGGQLRVPVVLLVWKDG